MPWIRLETGMKRDPRIWLMAEELKRDVGAVVGYVANVLAELPEHARDGDLSQVPDALLEDWALWPGKKGAFARCFTAHLCTDRTVRAWEKHNGSALRAADATRTRVRAYRERNATSNASGNALRNAASNPSTERNGTERNGKTKNSPAADAPEELEFTAFWAEYPSRLGSNPKQPAREAWRARRREGVLAEDILAGLERYRAHLEATGKVGTAFVQQAATFLSKSKRSWEEGWALPDASDDSASAAIAARAQQDADQAWLAQRRPLVGATP
jgi:hypothetical protein